MAASPEAAATWLQPTKVRNSSIQLRSAQTPSKAFGLEQGVGCRVSLSLKPYLKDLAQRCVDSTKLAGFALATSALILLIYNKLTECS